MKPASAKGKGRRFQQRVAASIRKAFPRLTDDDCFSTSMGAPGEDIRLSAAARAALPLSLECKCVEKLNVWECLRQCEANAPDGTTPCLVFSRNHAGTYAVLPWEAVLELYRAREEGGEIPRRLRAYLEEAASFLTPSSEAA